MKEQTLITEKIVRDQINKRNLRETNLRGSEYVKDQNGFLVLLLERFGNNLLMDFFVGVTA